MLNAGKREAGQIADVVMSLDALVPKNHLIRRIDRAIDWEARTAPLREWYPRTKGRPSCDPETLLASMLLRQIFHIESLRALSAVLPYNVVYRWFIGCPLNEKVPHFSTFSQNLLHRIPADVFEKCFADAVCDIIDARVMKPADLVYESPLLTQGRELPRLAAKYYIIIRQMKIEDSPHESDTMPGQVSLAPPPPKRKRRSSAGRNKTEKGKEKE